MSIPEPAAYKTKDFILKPCVWYKDPTGKFITMANSNYFDNEYLRLQGKDITVLNSIQVSSVPNRFSQAQGHKHASHIPVTFYSSQHPSRGGGPLQLRSRF